MLDERSKRLLAAVSGICGDGYKIIDETELLGLFSPADLMNADRLRETVQRLELLRYLDVRYAEDGEYCLRPLPAGVRYLKEETGEKKRNKWLIGLYVAGGFLTAFSGGFLGALLAWVVTV